VAAGSEEVLHYVRDALGSVVGLLDAGEPDATPEPVPAKLVERYDYDPYGKTYIAHWDPAAGSGSGDWVRHAADEPSAFGNPFMWTGQRHDVAIGLYHFPFRTYSPRLGRWLQRDPLGYVDGVNLVEYVRSMVNRFVDPLGLTDEPPTEGQGHGGATGVSIGILKGLGRAASGAIRAAYVTVAHPVQTVQGVGSYVSQTHAEMSEGNGVIEGVALTAAKIVGDVTGANNVYDAVTGEDAVGNKLSAEERAARATEGVIDAATIVTGTVISGEKIAQKGVKEATEKVAERAAKEAAEKAAAATAGKLKCKTPKVPGQQYEEIVEAQQRLRHGKGTGVIDSTRKSKQRDRQELQEAGQDALDEINKKRGGDACSSDGQ
jgi:RHS repeat-associated protein